MPVSDDKAPVAEDIPVSRAWRSGRRIYVRSGYKSKLGDALYEIGSTWDKDEEARYFGTGAKGEEKLARLLPLIRETEEYRQRSAAVKAAGLWIDIPIRAKDIREDAKKNHGAVFDGTRKEWAVPTDEDHAAVQAKVDEYLAAHPKRPARSRQSQMCDECGERRGRHERQDSSGIWGKVCDRCDREPSYVLSFA